MGTITDIVLDRVPFYLKGWHNSYRHRTLLSEQTENPSMGRILQRIR
jgi:hypothetical protein